MPYKRPQMQSSVVIEAKTTSGIETSAKAKSVCKHTNYIPMSFVWFLFRRRRREPATKSDIPLTFNTDDMVAYLLLNLVIGDQLDQVVDCVDRRVDALEPLDLLSDRQRVVYKRMQVSLGRGRDGGRNGCRRSQ